MHTAFMMQLCQHSMAGLAACGRVFSLLAQGPKRPWLACELPAHAAFACLPARHVCHSAAVVSRSVSHFVCHTVVGLGGFAVFKADRGPGLELGMLRTRACRAMSACRAMFVDKVTAMAWLVLCGLLQVLLRVVHADVLGCLKDSCTALLAAAVCMALFCRRNAL